MCRGALLRDESSEEKGRSSYVFGCVSFYISELEEPFFFLFLSTESPCSAEPCLGFSDFCCRTRRAAFLVGYSGSSEHI